MSEQIYVCPDMVHAEVKAILKRRRAARVGKLRAEAEKKFPLFPQSFIDGEMKARPEYYNPKPEEHDYIKAKAKISAKGKPGEVWQDVYVALMVNATEESYESSGIGFWFRMAGYRDWIRRRVSRLEFAALQVKEAQFYPFNRVFNKSAERADFWYQARKKVGERILLSRPCQDFVTFFRRWVRYTVPKKLWQYDSVWYWTVCHAVLNNRDFSRMTLRILVLRQKVVKVIAAWRELTGQAPYMPDGIME